MKMLPQWFVSFCINFLTTERPTLVFWEGNDLTHPILHNIFHFDTEVIVSVVTEFYQYIIIVGVL